MDMFDMMEVVDVVGIVEFRILLCMGVSCTTVFWHFSIIDVKLLNNKSVTS